MRSIFSVALAGTLALTQTAGAAPKSKTAAKRHVITWKANLGATTSQTAPEPGVDDPAPTSDKPADAPADATTEKDASTPAATDAATPTDVTTSAATENRSTTTSKLIATLELPRAEEPPPQIDAAATVKAPKTTRATPRFAIAAGGFLQTRGMEFDYDADADGGPPSYDESSVKGFAASAAIYPLPLQKQDGVLSGVGFAVHVAKSVGSTIIGEDETGIGEYELNHSAYDLAVRYRYPYEKYAFEGEVSYGAWTHQIIDLPESIAIPDTSYQYLSAAAHVDVFPSSRASIGFGARYLSIISAGDVTAEDWYGAGSGRGVQLSGDVVVPLSHSLFVRGDVDWRRVTVDFQGSGDLSWYWGVGTMYDRSLTGSLQLGVEL